MKLNNLVESFNESINDAVGDSVLFKALFIIAPPGAGKSTISRYLIDGYLPATSVNFDIKYEHLLNKAHKTEIPSAIFQRAQQLFFNSLKHQLNNMIPLVIETTATNLPLLARRREMLHSIGYDIGAVFIDVDKDTTVDRVHNRNKVSNRKIPSHELDTMINSYYGNIDKIKQIFHSDIILTINNNSTTKLLTNKELSDFISYSRPVRKFFMSRIKNEIGINKLMQLRKEGGKYLTDTGVTIDDLLKLAKVWY